MRDVQIDFYEKNGVCADVLSCPDRSPDRLIVLLHGYQGDRFSNREFGMKLLQSDSRAVVAVFDGLEPVPGRGDDRVRQWWDLPPFDGRLYSFRPRYAPKNVQPALRKIVDDAGKAANRLNPVVRSLMRSLRLKRIVPCGISQGGITAAEMVLFRHDLDDVTAALVLIGAGLPDPDRLERAEKRPFPVLLAGGWRDGIFPRTVYAFSTSVLTAAGYRVANTVADSDHFGLEHAVAPAVGEFLRALP